MTVNQVRQLVGAQIGNCWDTTNLHGVDLRSALVPPRKTTIINRTVRDGEIRDELVDVWLVLAEKREPESGYRIVFDDEGCKFGLASEGFADDEHLVVCGWYGDLMTAFKGM